MPRWHCVSSAHPVASIVGITGMCIKLYFSGIGDISHNALEIIGRNYEPYPVGAGGSRTRDIAPMPWWRSNRLADQPVRERPRE